MLLIWLILVFLLLLVFLLAVPVELSFSARLEGTQRSGDGQFRWLFGLVRVSLPRTSKPKEKTEPKKPKPRRSRKKTRSSPLALLSVDGLVGHVLTWVRRFLAAVHIHHLDVDARLGLGDPADTGRIWAFIWPVSMLLAIPERACIDIQPDFEDEILMFDGDGRIRVVPLQILVLALAFMLSLTTIRAFRAMRA